MNTELGVAKGYPSRTAAEVDLSVLDAAGIKASVIADDCGGAFPALSFTQGGARIVVPQESLAEARALLNTPAIEPKSQD